MTIEPLTPARRREMTRRHLLDAAAVVFARDGFHGASHRYISERVPGLLGRPTEGLRVISCHMGGSSSVCAISGVRTTPGSTALQRIPR